MTIIHRPNGLSPLDTPLEGAARESLARVLAAGVEAYDRRRMLPRLIRATPDELDDGSDGMRRALILRLARALRSERNRGRAGHWTYDLNRHIGLRQAYIAEKRAEAARKGAIPAAAPRPGRDRAPEG